MRERAARTVAAQEATRPRVPMNPLALLVTLLGVALIVTGLFLPAHENPGFSAIQHNMLIQESAVTWSVVVFGVWLVGDLALAYQRQTQPSWGILVFPVSVFATTARLLGGTTLYPVVGGRVDSSLPGTHAAAGVGVYAVLAGTVVCLLGAVMLRLSPGATRRKCPQCAELVMADAQVCRYCGHRLGFDEPGTAPTSPPPGPAPPGSAPLAH